MTKKISKNAIRLTVFAVLLFLGVGITAFLVAKPTAPTTNDKVVTHTEDSPAETPVNPSYRVAPGQPLSISISARGIEGNIQKVGVDQYGAVTAPNNVHLAGWFVNSALPGKRGLSIIDGHVDGPSQPGIFHSLAKVESGDKVIVTFGDKSTREFTVFSTKSVKTEEANGYLFSQDPSVISQLNLITCTGKFSSAQHSFDQRVIVSAKLED